MYVVQLALTGNFVVSSMRVFHALSAGKTAQPPIEGGGPTDTEDDVLPPEPDPEPELDPELDPAPELDSPPLDPAPPSAEASPCELDPELPPHDARSAA